MRMVSKEARGKRMGLDFGEISLAEELGVFCV